MVTKKGEEILQYIETLDNIENMRAEALKIRNELQKVIENSDKIYYEDCERSEDFYFVEFLSELKIKIDNLLTKLKEVNL